MRFFNDRNTPFVFRFSNRDEDLLVKPNELSPSFDLFSLNKNKIKNIFVHFPICFDSKDEQNRFEKFMIPYKLYQKTEEKPKVSVIDDSGFLNVGKDEVKLRFPEQEESMEVKELKGFEEIEDNGHFSVVKNVKKTHNIKKEKELIHPVKEMEDHHEDVMSNQIERLLNIPVQEEEEKKIPEYDPMKEIDQDVSLQEVIAKERASTKSNTKGVKPSK